MEDEREAIHRDRSVLQSTATATIEKGWNGDADGVVHACVCVEVI